MEIEIKDLSFLDSVEEYVQHYEENADTFFQKDDEETWRDSYHVYECYVEECEDYNTLRLFSLAEFESHIEDLKNERAKMSYCELYCRGCEKCVGSA